MQMCTVMPDDTDPKLRMPMAGPKLKDKEIADLRYWIQAMSAFWPEETAKTSPPPAQAPKFTLRPQQRNFWSLQPIRKPAAPQVRDANWVKTPIDRFILAKLEEKNLKPAKPADKRTLIRRASYDLTGLPPTPEQVDAFLADNSPEAYAKLIDTLLASPHYGERWARHWLDVARYADSGGYETDIYYRNAWRYRDYVVQSFNDDKPYNVFVQEQIAGDELWPDNLDLDPRRVYAVPQEK